MACIDLALITDDHSVTFYCPVAHVAFVIQYTLHWYLVIIFRLSGLNLKFFSTYNIKLAFLSAIRTSIWIFQPILKAFLTICMFAWQLWSTLDAIQANRTSVFKIPQYFACRFFLTYGNFPGLRREVWVGG